MEGDLKAENERLVSEMESMKKKIRLALKKQQAELQAKIQAAEQRALAAEAAALSSSPSHSTSDLEVQSCATSNGEAPTQISILESQLEAEKLKQEESSKEITLLKTELSQLQERLSEKIVLEENQRVDELSKANEKLEAQLLSAAQQVSDTFTRIADMHEKYEKLSNEKDTLNIEYEKLVAEQARISEDLQKANEETSAKTKEMEEIMASHKAAQEGQEAAMTQLMQQMQTIEASASGRYKDGTESTGLVEKLEELNRQLRNELQKSEADIELLTEQNKQLSTELSKSEGSVNHGQEQTDAEELLKELSDLKQSKASLEKELFETKEKLSQLNNDAQGGNLESLLKERDDKYAELDSKFNRLQKRAKQRIQEVQKEKDEVEAQLVSAQEKEKLALAKQTSLQTELERFRAQAGDAIRALDTERQNLRNMNSKLKEEADDLKRILASKEHNLEESRRLASEKDQAFLRIQGEMDEAEERYAAAVYELKEKNKKEVEVLQSQLADKATEINKLIEVLKNLQGVLVEKETKLTDLESALSGEVARLGAAVEAEKREAAQYQQELEKERERWNEMLASSETKHQQLQTAYQNLERTFSESKGQLLSQLEAKQQALADAEHETVLAKEEVDRLNKEFAAYKMRAHALLQKKDADLQAARDADLAAAQEAMLKDAQKQAAAAISERDRAVNSLKQAVTEYETQLAARNVAIVDAEQRIKDLAAKLESAKSLLAYEREEWRQQAQEIESPWQKKVEELLKNQKHPEQESIKIELGQIQAQYRDLKEEYENFRDLANKMMEEKDQKISKLLDDNDSLQKKIQTQATLESNNTEEKDSFVPLVGAEQQILLLARQQAQREEELKQCQRQIQVLQEELSELQHENQLHTQQGALLKSELRNMERAAKRETVDMTYLKNVILKLLETGEVEALLPVIGTLLQFSPEEVKRCHDSYLAAGADSPASTPRILLSRLSFSTTR